MSESGFFTIVSKNYISQALVLFGSFKEHHPDSQFYIFVTDGMHEDIPIISDDQLNYIFSEDIGVPNFLDMAFYYDCVEFNTALKPFAFNYILNFKKFKNIFFLDPDIFLFENLSLIENKLIDHNIILTPHITAPTGAKSDQLFMRYGVYNLGFIAISDTPESLRFIKWWMDALSLWCFDDKRTSLFHDQKWIDLVPSLFSDVHIERHPGCNVAYWNLHERDTFIDPVSGRLLVGDGLPVIFFHFSSVTFDDPLAISYKFNEFNLIDRPELKAFFEDYKELLIKSAFLETSKIDHAFNSFEDGTPISSLLRRVYFEFCKKNGFNNDNPFKVGSHAYKLGLSLPINGSDKLFKYYNSNTMVNSDWKVRFVDASIYIIFKLLGYKKSIAFFKYLTNSSDLSGLASVFVKYIKKI